MEFPGRFIAGALISIHLLASREAPAVPAFPGAEGYGANSVGGRGGTVVRVTNLNDSGAGSLRSAVSAANRTVIFDVSGTIDLQSDLKINRSNITVAGQTAPGDGIAVKRRLLAVENTHDVIIRYIRCRPGDIGCTNFQDDAFHVVRSTNVIVDHISSSWSIDEALSVTWSTNVTIQWCFIAESLRNSCHVEGSHGYGSLLRYANGGVSFHHNLYAHHVSRNPRLGDSIKLDFVNNLVYNWGSRAGYSVADTADNPAGYTNYMNYVGNYLVAGPNTGPTSQAFLGGATNTVIYQSGNLIDGNKNGSIDGANTGWSMFTSPYTQSPARFDLPLVTTDPAGAAFERVLAFAGASASRDAADARIVTNVRKQTGAIIDSQNQVAGWPLLASTAAPADTDNDGIADYWELAVDWNPSVPNNNHTNADGYTDLEYYLNWLASPHAVCNRNGQSDLDLFKVIGVESNFTFTVSNPANGTVTMLPDGHTARFVPALDFNGLASFAFSAVDVGTGLGFGPNNVSLLVSVTNAANTAPTLQPVSDQAIMAGRTLSFTNAATDTDQPPQTLTFILPNPPPGATLDAANGAFTWRPAITLGGTTNPLRVVVSDNGSPVLSATQNFTVTVLKPPQPELEPASSVLGHFSLSITGVEGPDYIIEASTNLFNWTPLFATSAPALPFLWSDPNSTSFTTRFYRVLLGP
jgi:pectate lyase